MMDYTSDLNRNGSDLPPPPTMEQVCAQRAKARMVRRFSQGLSDRSVLPLTKLLMERELLNRQIEAATAEAVLNMIDAACQNRESAVREVKLHADSAAKVEKEIAELDRI
jgi:hypothetical protein